MHTILIRLYILFFFFFFSSRRRHTRCLSDWSSDVCSSDLHFLQEQCMSQIKVAVIVGILAQAAHDDSDLDLAHALLLEEVAKNGRERGGRGTSRKQPLCGRLQRGHCRKEGLA